MATDHQSGVQSPLEHTIVADGFSLYLFRGSISNISGIDLGSIQDRSVSDLGSI
jgi:hypothetical protein